MQGCIKLRTRFAHHRRAAWLSGTHNISTPDTPISTDCGMINEFNWQEIIKDIKLGAARPDIHCKHMYLAEKNRYRIMIVSTQTLLKQLTSNIKCYWLSWNNRYPTLIWAYGPSWKIFIEIRTSENRTCWNNGYRILNVSKQKFLKKSIVFFFV